MRWTYDGKANALYVYLREAVVARQVIIDPDGVVMDVNTDGSPVGLEVIAPIAGFDLDAIRERFALTDEEYRFLAAIRGVLPRVAGWPVDDEAQRSTESSTSLVLIGGPTIGR